MLLDNRKQLKLYEVESLIPSLRADDRIIHLENQKINAKKTIRNKQIIY